jgi:hypothetical protein
MGFFGIFGRVIVEGTSMQPTYNPLDWLLVHYGFFGKKYLFLSASAMSLSLSARLSQASSM